MTVPIYDRGGKVLLRLNCKSRNPCKPGKPFAFQNPKPRIPEGSYSVGGLKVVLGVLGSSPPRRGRDSNSELPLSEPPESMYSPERIRRSCPILQLEKSGSYRRGRRQSGELPGERGVAPQGGRDSKHPQADKLFPKHGACSAAGHQGAPADHETCSSSVLLGQMGGLKLRVSLPEEADPDSACLIRIASLEKRQRGVLSSWAVFLSLGCLKRAGLQLPEFPRQNPGS